ncbi:hypothetical protein PC128_g26665 [Phytophthora cactorum]|nr:hypothetical protein PC128_g26665 [Phytophthora cactorum]
MTVDDCLADFKAGEIAEVVLLKLVTTSEELNASSVLDEDVLEEMKKRREARFGSEILKNPTDPVYHLIEEFGTRSISCLAQSIVSPGTGPCLESSARSSMPSLPRKAKAGMVRESKSPHSTPTICVRKPNGKWRLVHAYKKLNNETVSAQTPIPRKDVLLNNMAGCGLYSALDLVDGYYQILMLESDILLTAVSTRSGMLWEWLVMPQGLSNSPATFNRLVTQLFRPLRAYAQTYFDGIFVHSRLAVPGTAMEVHLGHLRRVLRGHESQQAICQHRQVRICVTSGQGSRLLRQQRRRSGRPGEGKSRCSLANASIPEGFSEVVGLGQLPPQVQSGIRGSG